VKKDSLSKAQQRIQEWRRDPVKFAVDCFGFEPDAWQAKAMRSLGGEINPKRLLCMKACTGPGKSATLAVMGWHRLACFAAPGEHPKGAALSITADNLKDNLWAELAKWQNRSEFLKAAFTWTKSTIYANDHPETWFLSARSFSKDADSEAIGRALSGLHSKFPFILLDETGDMPTAVGRAAMQIFTGAPIDAAVIQAGNPTSTGGLLYESCSKGSYDVITITADPKDPDRTPRVSKEHAQQMIDEYGIDNPWVMATILGKFPPTGFNSLFGTDDYKAATSRHYRIDQYGHAAKILGVDVARQGDDRSVIFPRQGVVAFKPKIMRIPDTMLVADQVARAWDKWEADTCFVDGTGGYGAGVIDRLRQLGYDPIEVQFSSSASDSRYFNKRSEMAFLAADWVKKDGGALPNIPGLEREMCAQEYTFAKDKFRLKEKEFIKDDIGESPDLFDALALTFAFPVAPLNHVEKAIRTGLFPVTEERASYIKTEYDPFA